MGSIGDSVPSFFPVNSLLTRWTQNDLCLIRPKNYYIHMCVHTNTHEGMKATDYSVKEASTEVVTFEFNLKTHVGVFQPRKKRQEENPKQRK